MNFIRERFRDWLYVVRYKLKHLYMNNNIEMITMLEVMCNRIRMCDPQMKLDNNEMLQKIVKEN